MDAKSLSGEPRCLISRTALLHNIAQIRKVIAPSVKVCAVVKADAYGHDANIVADTLCNFSNSDREPPMVEAFAVADLDEAARLMSMDLPILVLRPIENAFLSSQKSKIELACQSEWIMTVASISAAQDLARIAQQRNRRANVQVMINTGMNRAGVDLDHANALLQHIAQQPSLRLAGVGTHLVAGEEPDNPYNIEQLARFLDATMDIPRSLRSAPPQRTVANSAGVLFHPASHLDLVRPGLALYGIDPTCRPSIHRKLRPAMRWVAPLIGIRDLPAGVGVGYGQTWTSPRNTRLGLVPIGYADGYPRSLSNRGVMMVGGKPAPVAGRVSMDLTVIDLCNAPHATIGEDVTVLDCDPLSPASAYRIAELAGTIPYEIFCKIGPRVHRVAVDDFNTPVNDTSAADSSSVAQKKQARGNA